MLISLLTYLISILAQHRPSWQADFALALGADSQPRHLERAAIKVGPQLKDGSPKLTLEAKSAAAYAPSDKQFLYESGADDARPIASITKLMTALVFLDHNPDWEAGYEMKDTDRRDGGKIYLYRGDQVKIKDLWKAMLVGSDNTAAIALIHSLGMDEADFVAEMNAKAKGLGLNRTIFKDPVGLTPDNLSTAREVAIFAREALIREEISSTVALPKAEFKTLGGQTKTILSTDALLEAPLSDSFRILGGKTGYTEPAGYCFVGRFKDRFAHELVVVVLGTDSEKARFRQTAELAGWTYSNYQW